MCAFFFWTEWNLVSFENWRTSLSTSSKANRSISWKHPKCLSNSLIAMWSTILQLQYAFFTFFVYLLVSYIILHSFPHTQNSLSRCTLDVPIYLFDVCGFSSTTLSWNGSLHSKCVKIEGSHMTKPKLSSSKEANMRFERRTEKRRRGRQRKVVYVAAVVCLMLCTC
jgi:hypothetical protein